MMKGMLFSIDRVTHYVHTATTTHHLKTCEKVWVVMSVPTRPVPTPTGKTPCPTAWSVKTEYSCSTHRQVQNGGWLVTSKKKYS